MDNDIKYWYNISNDNIMIRNKNYKIDGKKINASESIYLLKEIEINKSSDEYIITSRNNGDENFYLIVEFSLKPMLNVKLYMTSNKLSYKIGKTHFDLLMEQFINENSTFKNNTFKIIPRFNTSILNGYLQSFIGERPVLVGNKLNTKYVVNKAENYVKIILDINSNFIAKYISTSLLKCLSSVTIDLYFLLQGDNESKLPEEIMTGVRFTGELWNGTT